MLKNNNIYKNLDKYKNFYYNGIGEYFGDGDMFEYFLKTELSEQSYKRLIN